MSPLDALMPTHAVISKAAYALSGKADGSGGGTGPMAHYEVSALQQLQDRIAPWQAKTFPKQSVKSKLMGMMRETRKELIPALNDLSEWADVLIYFTGAAAKQGIKMDAIVAAAHAKMDVNILRKWGKPDRDGLHHHVEEGK